MTKIETSSPTASLAGLIMACLIDTCEGRDMAALEIPGAFLQAKHPTEDKDMHTLLDRRIAELLAK